MTVLVAVHMVVVVATTGGTEQTDRQQEQFQTSLTINYKKLFKKMYKNDISKQSVDYYVVYVRNWFIIYVV